jgi:hypothetical protein
MDHREVADFVPMSQKTRNFMASSGTSKLRRARKKVAASGRLSTVEDMGAKEAQQNRMFQTLSKKTGLSIKEVSRNGEKDTTVTNVIAMRKGPI